MGLGYVIFYTESTRKKRNFKARINPIKMSVQLFHNKLLKFRINFAFTHVSSTHAHMGEGENHRVSKLTWNHSFIQQKKKRRQNYSNPKWEGSWSIWKEEWKSGKRKMSPNLHIINKVKRVRKRDKRTKNFHGWLTMQ